MAANAETNGRRVSVNHHRQQQQHSSGSHHHSQREPRHGMEDVPLLGDGNGSFRSSDDLTLLLGKGGEARGAPGSALASPGAQQEAGIWVKAAFFVCGMSVFARAETFVLQTATFAHCFGFGSNYYAMAAGSLFLPGFFINLAQSRYDNAYDLRFGTRRATLFRLTSTTILSVVAMIIYFAMADGSRGVQLSAPLHFGLLVLVGSCISACFGSLVQVISMFPASSNAWFYIGTNCPFLVFGPINIYLGEFCKKSSSHDGGYALDWASLWIFVIASLVLTLLGYSAFLGVMYSRQGRLAMSTKDAQLLKEEAAANPVSAKEIVSKIWPQLLSIVLVIGTSILVASLYIQIPSVQVSGLTTILLYEYYVAAALGMILSSLESVINLMKDRLLLLLASLRFSLVFFTLFYIQDGVSFRSDYMVIAVNFLNMTLGGLLFSLCFALSARKFQDKPTRTRASTFCNFTYFGFMAVFIGISLGIKKS